MEIKENKFGIEIELTGITRRRAAGIIAKHFGGESRFVGGGYKTWEATDNEGRSWKCMRDASIDTEGRSDDYSCEIVTPILRYEEIDTLQEIVRKLREKGAKANHSTGIHVHLDASMHTAKTLKNLVNIVNSKEDLLFKSLEVSAERAGRWCKKTDQEFLDRLNRLHQLSLGEIERAWYGGSSRSCIHYDCSRYHCLNLHSLFQRKGIEFRCFNGTTHAGKIKAYIQLVCAINTDAVNSKAASRAKAKPEKMTEKEYFRHWMIGKLGMKGEEYKTARFHLLAAF